MSQPSSIACPRCGSTAVDARVDGLCARCLGALNLAADTMLTGADAAPRQPVPAVEELAPLFPQLEILECLGRGGMGVVYRARQKSLDRMVALKLLAPERAEHPAFAARFVREARALAALNHPNIVAVHDFGEAGGRCYLLMEYVDGINLRQLLRTRRLTPEEALRIVPPVCAALECAHSHGIVHRDIKPENLLIDRLGTVKIADFGIAKMVETEAADSSAGEAAADGGTLPAGTPDYAAPEQRRGTADHRADIYSLGVVLYEMLTGQRPAAGLTAPAHQVHLDIRLESVVLRALEKSPELRFATAAEFSTAVEQAIQPGDIPASGAARSPHRLKRRALLALAGSAAVAGTWAGVRFASRDPEFSAEVTPLEITGSAVVIKLTTSQPRPPCELRMILTGNGPLPEVPRALLQRPVLIDFTALPRSSPTQQPWSDFGSARELTIAYVLPSETAAQQAWEQLQRRSRHHTVRIGQPASWLHSGSETVTEVPVFDVGDHRAVLRFSRPVTQEHPHWLAVKRSALTESGEELRIEWELRASRPGRIRLAAGAVQVEIPLTQPDGGDPPVYRVPLFLLCLREAGGGAVVEAGCGPHRLRLPLEGDAAALRSELRAGALNNYSKTERTWETELARPGGIPLILTLHDPS